MKKILLTNREQVINVLNNGRFASVTFIKSNGKIRRMTGQFGTKTRLKPGGSKSFKDSDKNLITIHEFGAFSDIGYKSFNVDRLISVKANGRTYRGKCWDALL